MDQRTGSPVFRSADRPANTLYKNAQAPKCMNRCWLYQSTTRQHGPMVVFSKSKSICADSSGGSPLTLRYRDAAERREKGRLCFIEGKGISFISNNRNFKQEKVDISRNYITTPKNKWTFLRKCSCFAFFFPTSSRKSPLKLTTTSRAFFAHTNVRPNGHAPAHRALNEFVFSAFTLHLHT